MTAATPRTSRSTAPSRLSSLGLAEGRQLLRNRTLMFMAALPIAFVVLIYRAFPGDKADLAAMSVDYLVQFSLLFCAYYPLVSMLTTRRDEKVLKRLRAGECSDAEILAAPALPTACLCAVPVLLGAVLLALLSGGAPRQPVLVILAVTLGIALCWGLALLTSVFTRNAEAAQMTSMPVAFMIMFSAATTRASFPEGLSDRMQYTPFAAVADLVHGGWSGTYSSPSEWARPLLILAAWTVGCCWAGAARMRWDERR